jgi:hypothetical protein
VTPVHGDEVDVDVDEQVRLGRPLVDLHLLALLRLADEGHPVGVLGVVVVEQPGGSEGVVHPVAHGVAQLGLGHAAVQRQGGDQVHVVDAGLGRHVEHGLDDALADVGPAHRRQGQRHVVEGDRQLHARPQQRRQRLAVDGVEEGVTDGLVRVPQGGQRLGRVDHPTAHRQLLEAEALAVHHQRGRGRPVDLQHEAGTGRLAGLLATHRRRSPLRSKAIFTAPRRPASAAWASASS